MTEPKGLAPEVAAVWKARCEAWRWLRPSQRDALLMYCETWVLWRRALALVRGDGDLAVSRMIERSPAGGDQVGAPAVAERWYAARLVDLRVELGVGVRGGLSDRRGSG